MFFIKKRNNRARRWDSVDERGTIDNTASIFMSSRPLGDRVGDPGVPDQLTSG